ncbi:MAG: hypothetical protein HYW50_03715, partial [Candidatus Diapherotrites archaeon]|nr:hypothetical protein [Candidatus Diapherotrites archaeon]
MEKARAIVLLSVFLALFSAIFAIGDTISSSMPTGLIAIPIDVDASELEQFFENGELKPEYVQQINENIDQIPPFVLETFAEGKTNVTFVTNENQELKFSVAVKDNQVISAKEGFEENADAEVKVDEKTIE